MEEQTRNVKLYEFIKAYTIKLLEMVKSHESSLTKVQNIVWIKSGNTFQRSCRSNIFTHKLLEDNKDYIHSLPEYELCKSAIDRDKLISKQMGKLIGSYSGGASRLNIDDFMNRIWKNLISEKKEIETLDFDVGVYDLEYKKLEDSIYADSFIHKRITPLFGLDLEEDMVNLSDDIALVKLKDDEILDYLNRGLRLGVELHYFLIEHASCALTIHYRVKKIVEENNFNAEEDVKHKDYSSGLYEQKVIDVLRLLKAGKLVPFETFSYDVNYLGGSMSANLGTSGQGAFESHYKISTFESDELIELWKMVTSDNIKKKKFIDVGLRRFSQSRERMLHEDELIDLLICAEALFLNDQYPQELGYRLALRASYFLEEDDNNKRMEIFKFMKSLYSARSSVVHGRKDISLPKNAEGKKYHIIEFCKEAEEYLRRALKKAIRIASENPTRGELINWDEIIFQIDREN